ncbi:M1 family metallopeptidase [Fulvivirga sedimenti]|uniref:Aminopeptidase N n=1 Tax=Fulvivirga sedimenti TaxID=2879465 RepID=A0A9X1HVH1_9BACT|nr:M1 family metallopeptidase [Fulvivirga sedimenti]MCA6079029.1 M1 family metallopeptidase [Fulvivirga sedimenti]
MPRLLLLLIVLIFSHTAFTQVVYDRNEGADVTKYTFRLSLNDSSNVISGEATIDVTFSESPEKFKLDLIGSNGEYGMKINEVREGESAANWTFEEDEVIIYPSNGASTASFTICYSGIPERGLVIDKTKFGKRSFFGDNWPTLARHWLPCVDHPYDKAAVEFQIHTPAHYDVVATGKKIEESYITTGYKLTRYYEPAPVATKVMTIGVCEFASEVLGYVDNIEISAWVYPENRLEGFSDYAVAVEVMEYFIKNIGPYSYAKLANMQAKTQWGGLENAGTIAYRESSVTGKNEVEGLIAHEIAHQWFGNSASEDSWNHVWLSEGFATYFTILYLENKYGDATRRQELVKDRREIIEYYGKNPSSVVDYSITDAMNVLSTNTYQKGGWVLNMLRHKIGDEVFWNGIRRYYVTYRNDNAVTEDFQKIMEQVYGESLEEFFRQWVYTVGYPELRTSWKYKKGKVMLKTQQVQDHFTFDFPLEIGLVYGEEIQKQTITINSRSMEFELPADTEPDNVIFDPDVWMLFKEVK